MAIISYSHRFEDAMLWRALGDVERGFYIDVGAALPKHESVTQLFYERGWTGINIEPADSRYDVLARERVHDVNLKILVGREDSTQTFFSIGGGNGLSTTREDYASQYQAKGKTVEEFSLDCRTLASIWRDHVRGPVHFLKVDVEGGEKDVLEGADFATQRPWVVLVEATLPMTLVSSHEDWEPILVNAGYRFVWFDEINRFYVAEEHHERLASAFDRPIEPRDGFVRWEG